jgi:hypothetical protein
MKNRMIVAGVSAFVLSAAGVASAQQIAPQCVTQAAAAGITATHDVAYNAADNSCVATPAMQPTVSSQGQFAIGALGAPVVVGGVIAALGVIALANDSGSTGATN